VSIMQVISSGTWNLFEVFTTLIFNFSILFDFRGLWNIWFLYWKPSLM